MNERAETLCRKRALSAERAVGLIRSGQRIFLGSNCAEPQTLVEALLAQSDRLADCELLHILTLGLAPYSDLRFENRFRHNAFFIGANVRDAVNRCGADYTPIFLSEVPALFRNGQIPLDVALIEVSPPDSHGYVSLGVSVDVVKAAVECAKLVIAEVNRRMPRTLGDSTIHVSQVGAFVESDRPLPELPLPKQTEVTRRIGQYIADLIEDGATLQLGIGAIPDAVLAVLENKRDLGIHTEMFSDGVMRLVEMGVITGRRKSLRPGKIVTTFCMGSRALYDFVDNNPGCEFLPTEYVNDPFTIARNDHMVAINAAIEVDLTGQVCSDSIGSRFYSGIGGQVDFIRGAARSRGGKPVIALPSTATLRDGRVVSKIVPVLQEGAGVVTSRGDVHYVVTEWGVAYLHGKSVRERALALVSIAHPDFRENLLAAAKGRCLITPDVSVQALTPRYPEEMEEDAVLNDGTEVLIRPIRPMDEDLLREFHYRLSDTTVYRRYRRPLKSLPRSERLKLVDIDYQSQMALIAVRRHDTRDEMLGVARYFVDPATRTAEVAFVVRDDWHGKGIGGLLLGRLIGAASGQGLHALEAYCQLDNLPMIDLLLRRGFVIVEDNDPDTRRLRLNLEAMPSK